MVLSKGVSKTRRSTKQFEVAVDSEACKDCQYCTEVCKFGVFSAGNSFNKRGYRPVQASRADACVGCMLCFYVCPDFAISIQFHKGTGIRS